MSKKNEDTKEKYFQCHFKLFCVMEQLLYETGNLLNTLIPV
jgi:hypothetical protein